MSSDSADRLRTIGSVSRWMSGGTPDRSKAHYWQGDIPWISAFTLKRTEIFTSDQFISIQAARAGSRMAPINSTLLLVRGSALHKEIRTGIVVAPVAFNQDVKALVPSAEIEPKYLTFAIQGSADKLLRLVTSAGNTAGVLDTKVVQDFQIWMPERPEQRAIIERLNDVDALISSLEKLVDKKHAIRQGMRQQLLTGKTRLPGFIGEWRKIQLGDHVTYVKTVPLSRAQLDDSSPLRCLHYGDIHTNAGVRLAAATAIMPRATIAVAGTAGRLAIGDLVFADASEDPSGVGKSVEITSVPQEGVVPGLHTIAARLDKNVIADGFKAYLQFIPEFRNSLLRLASGTKVLATTRTYISSVTLQLPDVAEQSAIAQVLRDADDEIDALNVRLAKAMSVKQGMMQELLTGRTRLMTSEPSV